MTITTESGKFTGLGSPFLVTVNLLPNTVHHLKVTAKVREIRTGGCTYGGYTFTTRLDKRGGPLVIHQGEPVLARLASTVITPDNAFQLQTLVTIVPGGELRDLIFSSDSQIISIGGKLSQWDVTSGREIGRIGRGDSAFSADISPDGSLLVISAAGAASIRLLNTSTGSRKELGRHQRGTLVESVAFNPSGNRVASGDRHNKVWVWDVASGQATTMLEGDVKGRLQGFWRLYWIDDDTLIAAGSHAVYWWNVTTGQLLERLAVPERAAFFVHFAFAENGDRIAAAAQDDVVYLWDREVSKWATWRAPVSGLFKVAFSPDGRLLAAATLGGQLLLWNVSTQGLLASHSLPADTIVSLRFSPDGRYLGVVGSNRVIWLWGIP